MNSLRENLQKIKNNRMAEILLKIVDVIEKECPDKMDYVSISRGSSETDPFKVSLGRNVMYLELNTNDLLVWYDLAYAHFAMPFEYSSEEIDKSIEKITCRILPL